MQKVVGSNPISRFEKACVCRPFRFRQSDSVGLILLTPFTTVAESTDRAVWALIGSAVTTSVTTPFVALYSTLLYYDLLARRA